MQFTHSTERSKVISAGYGFRRSKLHIWYRKYGNEQYNLLVMLEVFHWKIWTTVAIFALLFFVIFFCGSKDVLYSANAVLRAFLYQKFEEKVSAESNNFKETKSSVIFTAISSPKVHVSSGLTSITSWGLCILVIHWLPHQFLGTQRCQSAHSIIG